MGVGKLDALVAETKADMVEIQPGLIIDKTAFEKFKLLTDDAHASYLKGFAAEQQALDDKIAQLTADALAQIEAGWPEECAAEYKARDGAKDNVQADYDAATKAASDGIAPLVDAAIDAMRVNDGSR